MTERKLGLCLFSLLLLVVMGCSGDREPAEVPQSARDSEISSDPGPVPDGQSEPAPVEPMNELPTEEQPPIPQEPEREPGQNAPVPLQ